MLKIFLDVDGVLNSSTLEKDDDIELGGFRLNQFNLNNFKKFCNQIGQHQIVLSSDWRFTSKGRNFLKKIGGIEFVGHTSIEKDHIDKTRGELIQDWCGEDIETIVIIDDMDAQECVPPNLAARIIFHRTNYSLGFTEEDVDSLLEKIKC